MGAAKSLMISAPLIFFSTFYAFGLRLKMYGLIKNNVLCSSEVSDATNITTESLMSSYLCSSIFAHLTSERRFILYL
jgi:hypothetical protein